MATIVFTWEIGAGMGHVIPYLSLTKSLQNKGHNVIFILKDLTSAGILFSRNRIVYFQAPVRIAPIFAPIKTPCTYAQLLHNIGFDEPESLVSMVQGWRTLFNVLKPALVIFDHSPTALLAASGYPFKKIVTGTGFVVPPPESPLPNLRPWLNVAPEHLQNHENRTLSVMNRVLAYFRLKPLGSITELFAEAQDILLTFKELDPYKDRDNATYWGTWTHAFGEEPVWPDIQGRKIFVYLKPFPTLPSLLLLLQKLNMPTLIYIDRAAHELRKKFDSPALNFAYRPQDMSKASAQCDLAILNGTHHTAANMLMAGKPCLHLPIFLEQYLTAKRIEEMGAGISVETWKPEDISDKLNMLLKSDSYAEGAKGFASRYNNMVQPQQNEQLASFIDNMLK